MLKDLGLNHRREKNWFKDMFMPAYPSLYNGLVDEFKQRVGEDHVSKVGTTSGVATPESVSETAEPLTPLDAGVNGYSSGLSLDSNGDLHKKLGYKNGES